jgi:hypothetical protein
LLRFHEILAEPIASSRNVAFQGLTFDHFAGGKIMKQKYFLRYFLAFIIFLIITATAETQTSNTIKIGVAGAHTGDLASYRLSTVRATKLVVKK